MSEPNGNLCYIPKGARDGMSEVSIVGLTLSNQAAIIERSIFFKAQYRVLINVFFATERVAVDDERVDVNAEGTVQLM